MTTTPIRVTTLRATVADHRPPGQRPCGHPGRWCVHTVTALTDERLVCGKRSCPHITAARQAVTR